MLEAFAKPEIYQALETRGVQYAIRIPANKYPRAPSASRRRNTPSAASTSRRVYSPGHAGHQKVAVTIHQNDELTR